MARPSVQYGTPVETFGCPKAKTNGEHRLASQEDAGGHKQEEHHRDDAVHGEKGSVKPAEVVGAHQGMFPSQQSGNHSHARQGDPTKSERDYKRNQQQQYVYLKAAHHRESITNSE